MGIPWKDQAIEFEAKPQTALFSHCFFRPNENIKIEGVVPPGNIFRNGTVAVKRRTSEKSLCFEETSEKGRLL